MSIFCVSQLRKRSREAVASLKNAAGHLSATQGPLAWALWFTFLECLQFLNACMCWVLKVFESFHPRYPVHSFVISILAKGEPVAHPTTSHHTLTHFNWFINAFQNQLIHRWASDLYLMNHHFQLYVALLANVWSIAKWCSRQSRWRRPGEAMGISRLWMSLGCG